jgi:hypothetical protein
LTTPGSYSLDHLGKLSDHRGLFEHASGTLRREENGYCTDDNARLLVVTCREPDRGLARSLSRIALRFVLEAQSSDGKSRNRMDRFGNWTDEATTDDCWGRSLWALGTAAIQHQDESIRQSALAGFDKGIGQRSPWSRSMAFAALGAAEVLSQAPAHEPARALLVETIAIIGPIPSGSWSWPEPRLRYANAALAEAAIAAGAALGSSKDLDQGLKMLKWLLNLETTSGHLSVTGVEGRGPRDRGVQFDQQPIEVASMADACWRAYHITGDQTWVKGVTAAADWFTGSNDLGLRMCDEVSKGGFDGLHSDRVNVNQGAESTLALISTMQRARSFVPAT